MDFECLVAADQIHHSSLPAGVSAPQGPERVPALRGASVWPVYEPGQAVQSRTDREAICPLTDIERTREERKEGLQTVGA